MDTVSLALHMHRLFNNCILDIPELAHYPLFASIIQHVEIDINDINVYILDLM